jgi:beta-N-acetylhexosaminidase
VVDVVTRVNPWLLNRTLQADPRRIGRVASAFVRGVQAQGVAVTAKHFPATLR